MKDKRIGKFTIPHFLISETPEDAYKLFKLLEFVPLRAECLFYIDAYEYVGYSPKFHPIEAGEEIPTYIINLNKDENKIEVIAGYEKNY